jgi:VanZ family protein
VIAFFIVQTNWNFPALLRRYWHGVGWFGVALLIYLSLTPQPLEFPLQDADKLGHALAYAVLMYWWAQLLVTPRQRLWLAMELIGLGIALEYVQGWTGWRTLDNLDMLANGVGVAFGGTLASIAPNLLAAVGRIGKLPG